MVKAPSVVSAEQLPSTPSTITSPLYETIRAVPLTKLMD